MAGTQWIVFEDYATSRFGMFRILRFRCKRRSVYFIVFVSSMINQQVNALEITPDKQMIASCGFQNVKMYDLVSSNPDPLYSYNGVMKNISRCGFQVRKHSKFL